MSQSLLVFILSIVVFVVGAVFINFTVKREEAAEKAAKQEKGTAIAAASEPVAKTA